MFFKIKDKKRELSLARSTMDAYADLMSGIVTKRPAFGDCSKRKKSPYNDANRS